jgi:thiamine biosynthesis lipoprotein
LLLLFPFAVSAEWIGDARPMMGTEVSVYLWSDDSEAGHAALEAVFQEAGRIDRLMSTYKDDSEISKINRLAAISPVIVGNELFALIRRSIEISQLTGGAFDITYESVGQYFDFRERQRPDAEIVAAELENIDYRFLELDEDSMTVAFQQSGVRINLGGIAKGYVVERGIEIVASRGISNAIVTAGGDSRLLGDRRGRPWMVGIRDPRKDGEVAISIPLADDIDIRGLRALFRRRWRSLSPYYATYYGHTCRRRPQCNGLRPGCSHDGCIVDERLRYGRGQRNAHDCGSPGV